MSANIWANDTMFSYREKPWHGLGTVIQEAPNSADALRIAKLDWEVQPQLLWSEIEGNSINLKHAVGYYANMRMDTKDILGIVGERYKILQNKDAFAFCDALLGEGVRFETAGSLKNGRVVWMLARLHDVMLAGDATEDYLLVVTGHDGSMPLSSCKTMVRVVCNNTLNMALSGAQRKFTLRHSATMEERMHEAGRVLGLGKVYTKIMEEEADRMANSKMNMVDWNVALANLFPINSKTPPQTERNMTASRETVLQIHNTVPDIAPFRDTQWGFLQAVSQFAWHSKPMRDTEGWKETRMTRVIGGNVLLDKAYSLVAA